ncbi:DUF4244 domain-containing protein [Sphaerisporangium album]|uniref:DUF4244 domain-containing protein n=1 Tax=Sphaerisporangium album TaxID=509200 RepID=A0A367FKT3_9ACTN|nr:DUF4244 domain-containing protein [Sphaerisporangium album]RCG30317.1 DUF4244 domain-containing protein [Sphaerisporangium album]
MDRWIHACGRRTPVVRLIGRGLTAGRRLRRWGERFRGSRLRLTVVARPRGEAGMSTAEYAVGTIAACAFAGLLYKIVSSEEVRKMLSDVIGRALKLAT